MPSLKELRRATADRVAPFELAHTGMAQGTGYAGTTIDGSRRKLVSEELASVTADGFESENPTDYLKNEWLYLCSDPPEQRRIPEGGYLGYTRADEAATGYNTALVGADTPTAIITVERPFSAVVPAGLELEIHAIPPLRGGKSAGLHAAIQRALRVILREDTVGVPGVSGRTTLDVTASFPWMTNPGCFVGATYVETQAGVEQWAIPGARLRFDGDRVLLTPNTTVSSSQTLPVRVLRPLGSWIKAALSSVWAESSVGLVDDDDEVLGDPDSIGLVAAFHVAEAQAAASIVGSLQQTYWLTRAAQIASRTPFLRDQRTQRPRSAGAPFPDFTSVDGAYGGRWPAGPYWR